jgi:hypothetical protein
MLLLGNFEKAGWANWEPKPLNSFRDFDPSSNPWRKGTTVSNETPPGNQKNDVKRNGTASLGNLFLFEISRRTIRIFLKISPYFSETVLTGNPPLCHRGGCYRIGRFREIHSMIADRRFERALPSDIMAEPDACR